MDDVYVVYEIIMGWFNFVRDILQLFTVNFYVGDIEYRIGIFEIFISFIILMMITSFFWKGAKG